MQKDILLTGFEPFKQHKINSSGEAVKLLAQRCPQMHAVVLPVDYWLARNQLLSLLEEVKPKICVCTGLAPHLEFRIEQIARKPKEFAEIKGADTYEGVWPWAEMETQLRLSGREVRISKDAGQYVCESTYWSLLDFREKNNFPQYAAFLHVAPLSDLFSVELIAEALENLIHTRLKFFQ